MSMQQFNDEICARNTLMEIYKFVKLHGVMTATDFNRLTGLPNNERRQTNETVSHPVHYQSESGLEAIHVIEAFTSNLKGIEAFDAGNALKYICRWKNKNGLEDLKKKQCGIFRI